MADASARRVTAQLHYSVLNDDWEVGEKSFVSPMNEQRPNQALMFADRIKNGSISADITILETQKNRAGEPSNEASFVFRYAGPDGYYYAGTGAFGARFFIGQTIPGPIWQGRAYVGEARSLRHKKPYRLRIAFSGSRIVLYENDVQQLTVIDDRYSIGQCGLKAFGTRASFENVQIVREQPVAFVVMPFTSELDFVYRVLHEVVESCGVRCIRADEIFLSRPVMDDVKGQIAKADLVIVDFSGKNPNVYYEAGLADAWNKDWIILTQSADDLTFDVRHIRAIRYSNAMGADVKLRENLSQALEALGYRQAKYPQP